MPASPASQITEAEYDGLVELLRTLIRIRTVNPPGDEIEAARYLEGILAGAGLRPELFEPFPSRGSLVARVHGDGTGGEPLLLLCHLDVVPADPSGWSHDPFAGDLDGGYVWGRGAVDMKAMVAMEVATMLRLAARVRSAGRDPGADPVPGLRRDVIFAATADEEAGGWQGASWMVEQNPELLKAAAALNEAGGFPMEFAGTRFYPIQVAEKGGIVYTLTVRGRWGHGSIPTEENAAVLAARIVERLTVPGAPRITPAIAAGFAAALPHLPPGVVGRLAAPNSPRAAAVARGVAPALKRLPAPAVRRLVERVTRHPEQIEAALPRLCDAALAGVGSALMHDTVSPNIIQAGVKYNVIPGTAEIVLDCRTLPGTSVEAMTAELRRRAGEELWSRMEVRVDQSNVPAEAPADSPFYRLLERTIRDHDPRAVPVPAMFPYATDAKHLARIGVPCYGFSPLQMAAEDSFAAMLHADNERVSVAGLRWGYAVLLDAVERFCG